MADDNSDEEFPNDWVLYSERENWSDVIPLEQDDGDHPVVQIAYSAKFKDVFDYFRAIVASKEKSLRAMDLTKDALSLNAANYTVWQYRRDIIKSLNLSLSDELNYAEEIIIDNPKNYQVWHHRRVIVEWLNDPTRELQLTENILSLDAKNYHAWQHRQWVIKTYKLFDDELIYVDKLISEDVRNNSAWNQRYFVLKYTGFTPEILLREITYTMNRLRLVKVNESAWNFLRGILQEGDGTLNQFSSVVEFCEELYEQQYRSPYLIAFLIDMYQEQCLKSTDVEHTTNGATSRAETPLEDPNAVADKVIELCQLMSTKHDTIRQKYWDYFVENFKKNYKNVQCTNNSSNNSTNTTSQSPLLA